MPAYKAVIFKNHVVPGSRNKFVNPVDNFTVDTTLRMVMIPGPDGDVYAHAFEAVAAFVIVPDAAAPVLGASDGLSANSLQAIADGPYPRAKK